MLVNTIQDNLSKLSPKIQFDIYKYIELLVNQKDNSNNKNRSFSFGWEGGLSELKEEFNSVELQHKAMEMR